MNLTVRCAKLAYISARYEAVQDELKCFDDMERANDCYQIQSQYFKQKL